MAADFCPLVKGKCREHKCLWYVQVHGTHPQTDAKISEWGCAIAWLPFLLIENTKEARQTCASIDRFNNDMVDQNAIQAIREQIANSLPSGDPARIELGGEAVQIDQPRGDQRQIERKPDQGADNNSAAHALNVHGPA